MESLLLNFEEVARLIVFRQATIENWAYRRSPAPLGFPAPVKVGRLLRYKRSDIEGWIDKLGTSEANTDLVSKARGNRRRGSPTNYERSAAAALGLSVPAWRARQEDLHRKEVL